MKDIVILIVAGLLLLFFSASSYINGVKDGGINSFTESKIVEKPFNGEYDRSGKKFLIVIHTYDNIDQVTNSYINYNKLVGKENPYPEGKINGWSLFYSKGDDEPFFCFLHVTEPKTRNSEYMRTWGHELFHCVYGSFHEPTKMYRKIPKVIDQ